MEPMNDMEIRLKFQRIEDTLQAQDTALVRIEKTLESVESKVTFTNGKIGEVSKGQEQMKGAWKMLAAVSVLIILPLASWVLYNQTQENKHINAAIGLYLQNYYNSKSIQNAK